LHRAPDELPEKDGLQNRSAEEPGLCWKKPASRFVRERATGWNLDLDLVARNLFGILYMIGYFRPRVANANGPTGGTSDKALWYERAARFRTLIQSQGVE
jgi:hypothetical protein